MYSRFPPMPNQVSSSPMVAQQSTAHLAVGFTKPKIDAFTGKHKRRGGRRDSCDGTRCFLRWGGGGAEFWRHPSVAAVRYAAVRDPNEKRQPSRLAIEFFRDSSTGTRTGSRMRSRVPKRYRRWGGSSGRVFVRRCPTPAGTCGAGEPRLRFGRGMARPRESGAGGCRSSNFRPTGCFPSTP